MSNTLIGSTVGDTLDKARAVLALLEVSADHLATQTLGTDAATGLCLVLGLVGDAVAAARLQIID